MQMNELQMREKEIIAHRQGRKLGVRGGVFRNLPPMQHEGFDPSNQIYGLPFNFTQQNSEMPGLEHNQSHEQSPRNETMSKVVKDMK